MTDDRWVGSSTPYLTPSAGDAWGSEAAQRGRSGTQRILSAEEVSAPVAIAEALQIPPGSPVVRRERLIVLDERPIEVARSFWPAAIARDTALAGTGKIRGGAVSLLADLGYAPGSIEESIQTRPPTASEGKELQLADAGEWVLVLTRTITTNHGAPYEVSVMVSPGRVGRLHYSMKVD
ncbi:GntR family transcriptional regulator [Streptomyces sp. N35]|uniref:GntR family transcriptional regulator n=1 Tax=Streptomyces sp. N35 TaxID=2795730 RepID=UPI0018F28713|nr:UTRA domain-containing protein [Streptomyces sp. N35]